MIDRWTAYYKIMLDYNGKVELARETDEAYEFIVSFDKDLADFWAILYKAICEDEDEEPMIRLEK